MQKHAKMRHSSKLISSDFSNLPPKEGQKKKRTVKLWNCEDFSRSQGRPARFLWTELAGPSI